MIGSDSQGTRVAINAGRDGASASIPVRGEGGLTGQDVTVGIRPEHMHLGSREPQEPTLDATVELLEQLGSTSFLYCALPGGEKLTVQVAGQVDKRAGDTVEVCFATRDAHVFAKSEGEPALERLH